MLESEPVVLNLRVLRERALRSRAEVADELGVSASLMIKLELGHGDTRLLTIFHLCRVLARYLELLPSQVLDALIPQEVYENFEDIRQRAAARLASLETQQGNFRAKRRFLRRTEARNDDQKLLEANSFYRFQLLFARSYYSQVELSKLTGLSERRLNHIFAISADRSGQMSIRIFLRLAAALAPVYGGGIKETAFYLVGSDLDKLDRYYQASRPDLDGKR